MCSDPSNGCCEFVLSLAMSVVTVVTGNVCCVACNCCCVNVHSWDHVGTALLERNSGSLGGEQEFDRRSKLNSVVSKNV